MQADQAFRLMVQTVRSRLLRALRWPLDRLRAARPLEFVFKRLRKLLP